MQRNDVHRPKNVKEHGLIVAFSFLLKVRKEVKGEENQSIP